MSAYFSHVNNASLIQFSQKLFGNVPSTQFESNSDLLIDRRKPLLQNSDSHQSAREAQCSLIPRKMRQINANTSLSEIGVAANSMLSFNARKAGIAYWHENGHPPLVL